MQRLFTAILLLGIVILGLNCQKELSFNGPGPVNNNPNPITATVQGNIKDESGKPAMGVTIKVGNKTATTNARGYFRITNAALDKQTSLVTAEKAGYYKAFRVFGATSGVNQVSIQLLKKTVTGTINSTTGGEISLANGSKVKLAANGVVKKSGGDYSGQVNVYATYIDPTSSNISEIVPGSFMAIDKNNNRSVLSSYGMLAVELESAGGEKLQVAAGSVATLTTAIPAVLQGSAPATIPLWYVDEQTGIWREEGVATKVGNNYVGDVKHFSFWNCDIPFPNITLSMTLKDPHGLPLVNVPVKLKAASIYGQAYGYTDSLGQVSGAVPSNMPLTLEVLTPCYTVVFTQNIGPFSLNTDLGTIIASINSNATTVTGRILNCSGAPVSNGVALIVFNNTIKYVETAADGTFSSLFFTCTSSPASLEVTGIDKSTQQQSLPVNVTISNPTSAAGDVTACGTSAQEFISYSIDGVTTNISNTAGGSLSAICIDSLAGSSTYMFGSAQLTNSYISFNFWGDRSPGVYEVDQLSMSNTSVSSLVNPFNVTVTSFPAPGGFIEGSVSGQYLDAGSVSHTLNATFRVRRQ